MFLKEVTKKYYISPANGQTFATRVSKRHTVKQELVSLMVLA